MSTPSGHHQHTQSLKILRFRCNNRIDIPSRPNHSVADQGDAFGEQLVRVAGSVADQTVAAPCVAGRSIESP
jgi:hypothetical protein